MNNRLKNLAIALAALSLAQAVRADTLWISEGKNALKVDGVKILSVTGGTMAYVTEAGAQSSKTLDQLPQINVESETTFNAAEDAFAARDYPTALTNYQAVLKNSSSKDWIQTRAASRLLLTAKQQNRFDAEVDAYLALLQKDPAAAAANKPTEPPEHSQYLDAALASVSQSLSSGVLTDAQKSAVLSLQLQIDRAKGDTAGVNATLQQLVAAGGASDSEKVMLKLASANVALDAKQFGDAFNDIDQNRALFTDPDQQVDALFILAQAREALDADKTDSDTLKDLALNYMRVVTFGSQLADRPHVAESLYRAGQIEEKLKEPQAAISLYKQVVNDRAYAASPAVPLAKAAMDKLGSAGGSK